MSMPVNEPPPLAVTGLRKSFGGVRVLHDFELTIPAQSQAAQSRAAQSRAAQSRAAQSQPAPSRAAVAILGQNGAGKTTLLNLITRLVPADAGRIEVFGHNVLASGARQLAGYGVARTFQSPRLLLDETCLNNVALGAQSVRRGRDSASRDSASRDRGSAAARRRAADALDRVGLAAQAGRIAGTLPFGSRKLVELARALALQPRLLLLDEPAAGLSDLEESRLAGVLTGLADAGITLLLIEHRMALVAATASRVVMMDGGAIVFDGDAAAAIASPLVRDRYLGAGFDQVKSADRQEPGPRGSERA